MTACLLYRLFEVFSLRHHNYG